jgi:hypothetical protein
MANKREFEADLNLSETDKKNKIEAYQDELTSSESPEEGDVYDVVEGDEEENEEEGEEEEEVGDEENFDDDGEEEAQTAY